ncbi:MAG: transposase [Pyrinomonadaceae bacterium]
MIAAEFIKEGHPKRLVLEAAGVSRSSFYYRPAGDKGGRGRRKSTHTRTKDGRLVSNEKVSADIEEVLSKEFVDYGYLKVTHWLRQEKGYLVNPKKIYRLMAEEGLLNKFVPRRRGKRNWVRDLLPKTVEAFDYLEFDIKYVYVAGQTRNALVLTVIDVQTRWVLGQIAKWSISQQSVINLFDQFFEVYPLPKSFYVRNDNGSQFDAHKVQKYFEKRDVVQEFCKPATPEQNAHIESYHSILETVVCQRFEFETLPELRETLNRFVKFYNFKRIHSGVGYQSPYKYLLEKGIDMKDFKLNKALDSSSLTNGFPHKKEADFS